MVGRAGLYTFLGRKWSWKVGLQQLNAFLDYIVFNPSVYFSLCGKNLHLCCHLWLQSIQHGVWSNNWESKLNKNLFQNRFLVHEMYRNMKRLSNDNTWGRSSSAQRPWSPVGTDTGKAAVGQYNKYSAILAGCRSPEKLSRRAQPDPCLSVRALLGFVIPCVCPGFLVMDWDVSIFYGPFWQIIHP